VKLSRLLPLFRPRLVLLNGVASLAGYLLFPAALSYTTLAYLFTGVCLLVAAGSALNQVMERDLDAVMERTSNRPLVTGLITGKKAVLIATACMLGGAIMLHQTQGVQPAFPLLNPPHPCAGTPALIGLLALGWYLLFYTPLKRRSCLALLVGAVCGAAPPAIGWAAAGGSLADFRIILLVVILYLWQVPHFWLLQRRYADDYRRGGIPLFELRHHKAASMPLTVWTTAMIAAIVMLPLFGLATTDLIPWVLALTAALSIALFSPNQNRLFPCLNLFPLLVTLLICAGR
jgi:heme o synthase